MPHEVIEHKADIKIRVWGSSLENLFSEAVLAMMGIINPLQNTKMHESTRAYERKVDVEAPDKTALLVDFLSEILAFSQTYKEIYAQVSFTEFNLTKLKAVLEGVKVDKFDEDIKAVTYHEADVKQNEKGEWETVIIFDI